MTKVRTFKEAVDATVKYFVKMTKEEGYDSFAEMERSQMWNSEDIKEEADYAFNTEIEGVWFDEDDCKTLVVDAEENGVYTWRKFIMAVRKELKAYYNENRFSDDEEETVEEAAVVAEETVESEEVNETETGDKKTANMKYEMTVTIANPNTPKGMTSDIVMKMTCTFGYDPKQYGNGYAVFIDNGDGFGNYIDLRYDTTFNPDKKKEYLEKWARNYWNGKDGAYIVKSLKIN